MKAKITRLYQTVKYLRIKQIYYRIFYIIRKKTKLDVYKISDTEVSTQKLSFTPFLKNVDSYVSGSFNFLNIQHTFTNNIDWNYNEYGKLWTYNLTYFDFLNQKSMTKEIGLDLINDFIDNIERIKDGLEPFPISLRAINWIKFLSQHGIEDDKINTSLYYQYKILSNNLEYHLLGNHLLENAFSLLYGAYYFNDNEFYKKSLVILNSELEEQILEDGAHFELSPMYHQLMLFRLLDCINLLQNNTNKEYSDRLSFLIMKASEMLAWLKNITYRCGAIPLFNDAVNGIAPISTELYDYADRLNIEGISLPLQESGYRKRETSRYELVVDVGDIGPDYIPGHAHSDTFNFELYVNNKPFIVDTGLSTYESNERRQLERSTESHNTVVVNGINQSDVWGGFRVANRAFVIDLQEKKNSIQSTHNGYKKNNIFHTRKWLFEETKVIIEDSLSKEADAIARIHFHPDVTKEEILKCIITDEKIKFIDYKYAPEFNKLIDALLIEIKFRKNLKVEIKFIKDND